MIDYNDDLLIVGLARNCEKKLTHSIEKISAATKNFKNINWLIIESDSEDGTLNILKDTQRKIPNFDFYTFGKLQEKLPLRTERIAHCRNKYLDELKKNKDYQDVKYLIVADLDGVNNRLTQSGFESCWSHDDWVVCTANQSAPYYDIWALRHPLWNSEDCWKVYNLYRKIGATEYNSFSSAILSKMVKIPPTSEWIEVDSAFGGLGVYDAKVLNNATYVGIDSQGMEVCEHVAFHAKIKKKDSNRIFINPKLINCGFMQHNKFLFPGVLFLLKIKMMLPKIIKKNL